MLEVNSVRKFIIVQITRTKIKVGTFDNPCKLFPINSDSPLELNAVARANPPPNNKIIPQGICSNTFEARIVFCFSSFDGKRKSKNAIVIAIVPSSIKSGGGADEALEQHIDAGGIDRGDAEAIADDRIGRRAAPLAQDAATAGEGDDVAHGEEIARVLEPLDQRQLVLDQVADALGDGGRKALGGALPGQFGEALLRGQAGHLAFWGDRLLGVFVAQFVEAEPAAPDDLDAAGERVLVAAEEARHLRGRLQVALGMGGEAKPGLIDRAMRADAGQHILQRPPLGDVIEHIVDGDERKPGRVGDRGETGEAACIVAAIEMVRGEIGAAGEIRRDAGGELLPPRHPPQCPHPSLPRKRGRDREGGLRRQHGEDLAIAMGHDIGVIEMTLALGRAPLAQGQEASEAAIGGTVLRIGEEARAIGEVEPDADDKADSGGLRRLMRAHQPGDAVAVGDRDRPVAKRRRGRHQFARMRGAAQEREIAGDLQLGVVRHAKRPCTNQRGGGSPGKPARNSQKCRPSSSSTR